MCNHSTHCQIWIQIEFPVKIKEKVLSYVRNVEYYCQKVSIKTKITLKNFVWSNVPGGQNEPTLDRMQTVIQNRISVQQLEQNLRCRYWVKAVLQVPPWKIFYVPSCCCGKWNVNWVITVRPIFLIWKKKQKISRKKPYSTNFFQIYRIRHSGFSQKISYCCENKMGKIDFWCNFAQFLGIFRSN